MNDLLKNTHPGWHAILKKALLCMDETYLHALRQDKTWLPGPERLLAAFSLAPANTRYILFGESPYPRVQSANGYAFWDEAVDELWSDTGLSKAVNRATSLRNFLKMLLLARGNLTKDFSQSAIAAIDKSTFCQTAASLFSNLLCKGFLLLNATLVYKKGEIKLHAQRWKPFMASLLTQLQPLYPSIQLLLFGNIAKILPQADFPSLIAEHPYNISFITNSSVLHFFKPLDLLTLS